ncbi:MAG: hypothetical protein S4CHLAM7_04010 [Chlamydiae bacterium]|nr:hypothetical protein [Chlamydiota bacterium]
MDNTKLNAKIASLESQVDHLESELAYVNSLLVRFGFDQGVDSLKMSLEEILAVDYSI